MGQPLEIICKTCKEKFYLGYGSGKFWSEILRPRFPRHLHEGHEYFEHCNDYTEVRKDGHLYQEDYGYTWPAPTDEELLWIKDYMSYKSFDLSADRNDMDKVWNGEWKGDGNYPPIEKSLSSIDYQGKKIEELK